MMVIWIIGGWNKESEKLLFGKFGKSGKIALKTSTFIACFW